jgi:GNAT superfamily N-acetyltransferase
MVAIEAAAARDPRGLVLQDMRPEDAEAALALSDEAGWNQTVEDWRFMLGDGRALGLREPGGPWIGSSLVLARGPAVSWISMVLIARRHRGQGLGTMLLDRCIGAVGASGAVPGLDATELGRPVYLSKGFRELYPISRWRLDAKPAFRSAVGTWTIRRFAVTDFKGVISFDERCTGMERGSTLHYLLSRAPDLACLAEVDGQLAGFALGRPGRISAQIGPVVAESSEIALALISEMSALGSSVILDVPDTHRAVTDWLQQHGGVRVRGFMRMMLGDVPGLRDPGPIFALAGPELS